MSSGAKTVSAVDATRRESIEPAPEAAVCGAIGCREPEDLYRVEMPDRAGERVLCPSCFPEELRVSQPNDRAASTESRDSGLLASKNVRAEKAALDVLAESPMPANEPTPRNGENVSERSVESEKRREWIEVRLAFVSDDILNPALVQGDTDLGLRERIEKAREEIELLEEVAKMNEDNDWIHR